MRKPEDRPMNYLKDGSWRFVMLLDQAMMEFIVSPNRKNYILTVDDRKISEGRVSSLICELELENCKYENTVRDWLRDSLSWKEHKNGYKKWEKTIEFEIDNRQYVMTCNPRTGSLKLILPEHFIISNRLSLGDNYPSLYTAHFGLLGNFLANLIKKSGHDILHDAKKEKLPATIVIEKYEIYDLAGWEIWVNYNSQTDIIFLYLSPRNIDSHVKYIKEDLFEWEILHNGAFKETVEGFLHMNGIVV
jgi:hypothetical protein